MISQRNEATTATCGPDARTPSDAEQHVEFPDLVQLLVRIFERHGCASKVAAILAENCASAERDAAKSHGIYRIPGYLSTLKSGWVDGRAQPVVEDVAPGFVRVDARNGFAQIALHESSDLLRSKARACGIAVLAIRNSHHFGALFLDVEPFAVTGLLALSVVNTWNSVVPHGGHKPVFGTNPIAFAAPRTDAPPLVFDQATSTMSNGAVLIAAREGRKVPPGVGVDRDGRPTCDPAAISDGGALLAFGGYKGTSIALMIEILCAALGGGQFSYEHDSSGYPGAETSRTGQTLVLIDPGAGASTLPPFKSRMSDLLSAVVDAGQTRLPGDRRLAARATAADRGIPISISTLAGLRELAADEA